MRHEKWASGMESSVPVWRGIKWTEHLESHLIRLLHLSPVSFCSNLTQRECTWKDARSDKCKWGGGGYGFQNLRQEIESCVRAAIRLIDLLDESLLWFYNIFQSIRQESLLILQLNNEGLITFFFFFVIFIIKGKWQKWENSLLISSHCPKLKTRSLQKLFCSLGCFFPLQILCCYGDGQ